MKDYKLLCYGDFAIPIPVWAEWIAWDDDYDVAWLYEHEPTKFDGHWDDTAGRRLVIHDLPLPEEGHWTTQLYKLEDL